MEIFRDLAQVEVPLVDEVSIFNHDLVKDRGKCDPANLRSVQSQHKFEISLQRAHHTIATTTKPGNVSRLGIKNALT